MKKYFLPILVLINISVFAQEEEIILKGKIYGHDGSPVDNAYIINFRDLSVWGSRKDGQFTISAMPGDSLIINHITFKRKKIYADSVKNYPTIFLEYNTRMIGEVNVGTDPNKLNKYVEENIESIKNVNIKVYKRIDPEMERIEQFFIENNKVLRTEASSVSMFSFSPSTIVKDLKKKKNSKEKRKGINFYRNEKHKARKENREAGR